MHWEIMRSEKKKPLYIWDFMYFLAYFRLVLKTTRKADILKILIWDYALGFGGKKLAIPCLVYPSLDALYLFHQIMWTGDFHQISNLQYIPVKSEWWSLCQFPRLYILLARRYRVESKIIVLQVEVSSTWVFHLYISSSPPKSALEWFTNPLDRLFGGLVSCSRRDEMEKSCPMQSRELWVHS